MSRRTSALTVLALALSVALVGCGDDESPTSSEPTSSSSSSSSSSPSSTPESESAPLELTVPAAQTGRCMAPNVDNLQVQDTAFEGVVTAAADGSATLEVSRSYKGEEADIVKVNAVSADLAGLLLAVDFQEGQTYLVSSLDGEVSVCGLSAVKDDFLADLYDRAYAG